MKKHSYIFIVLLYFFAFCPQVLAQYNLSGEVVDAKKQPLDGAIVSLLQAKDSAFIKTFITEVDGKFEFTVTKEGSYLVSVTQIGYANFISKPIELSTQNPRFTLPITMAESGQELKEVTLTTKKPFVERKIDRTVVNPDALISNAGANVLEVLEKAPAILVDADGNISLKGKQGVLVFIDDKPTYLSASELANYLRSLPAGTVETIEIMPNPPAKYDAAGNAGIINIRLKRNQSKGFNGNFSLSYGQGRYMRTNNSLNLTYRVNKFNFFSNLSANINNRYQDLTIWREYLDNAGNFQSAFTQNSYIKREGKALNLKMGVDYYISKKSTLGIVLGGFNNPTFTDVTNKAEATNAQRVVTSLNDALVPADEKWKNWTANLNYSYKIDSLGKELFANLDYLYYDNNTIQTLFNEQFTPERVSLGSSLLTSTLPATIAIQTAKVDYTNPLPKGAKLELGAKTSFIQTQNIADFFDVINNVSTRNNTFSNNFEYKENINAGYVNYSKEGKRFSIQAGLRFENTSLEGKQFGNVQIKDSSFARSYNSFFPTLFLSYVADTASVHQFGFSYGRRINRPNYQDMNPFTYPLDKFTLYGGNPYLRPTFSHAFELSHTFKNIITTTLQYSLVQDAINETIEQGNNIFYSRPGNIGSQVSYGISVNATLQPTKWWTIQLYTEVTHNDFDAILYGQTLRNEGTYWVGNATLQFQAGKTWGIEVGGNYQTSIYSGQFVLIPVGTARLAFSKKVLKEQGSLKLGINDVFYTQQPGGNIKGLGNSTARWYSLLDSRVITATFSYRFNKGKTLKVRQIDGSESERNRVR